MDSQKLTIGKINQKFVLLNVISTTFNLDEALMFLYSVSKLGR